MVADGSTLISIPTFPIYQIKEILDFHPLQHLSLSWNIYLFFLSVINQFTSQTFLKRKKYFLWYASESSQKWRQLDVGSEMTISTVFQTGWTDVFILVYFYLFLTAVSEQGWEPWKKCVGLHKYSIYSEAALEESNQILFFLSELRAAIWIMYSYRDKLSFQLLYAIRFNNSKHKALALPQVYWDFLFRIFSLQKSLIFTLCSFSLRKHWRY